MPVKTAKRGKKYRVIEAGTGHVAKNKSGAALDGKGHSTKKAAIKQVRAVNRSLKKRGKI